MGNVRYAILADAAAATADRGCDSHVSGIGSACLVLLLAWSAPAAAASFDCTKAQSRVEKAICADAEVSALDEHLARYYAAARSTLGRASDCMRTDQMQWLRAVRNACTDAMCLRKAYLGRLGELDALQRGASALRNIELPRVPTLVWIVPPAADTVAAPPRPTAKPLVARGRVVNDIVQGDGFVLRTAGGDALVLLLTMFLDSPTDTWLEVLAKDADATILARGHEARNSSGKAYYEPSRCVFLYRLP